MARRSGRGTGIADIGAEDAKLWAIVAVKRVEAATLVMDLSPLAHSLGDGDCWSLQAGWRRIFLGAITKAKQQP
jgi:hypothetical protein